MTQVEKWKHSLTITAGIRHSYGRFKKVFPQYDTKRKDYIRICYEINKKLSERIIKESLELKLPYKLGTLSIKKQKIKILVKDGQLKKNKMIVDWEKSWEMWKADNPTLTRKEIMDLPNKTVVYNMNQHTNGYIFSWVWDKLLSSDNLYNLRFYKFKPTKQNRLDLKDWLKSDDRENDYYVIKKAYYEKRLPKAFSEKGIVEDEIINV